LSDIGALKAEGTCLPDAERRQIKYLHTVIEADHGKLKRRIKPTLGLGADMLSEVCDHHRDKIGKWAA